MSVFSESPVWNDALANNRNPDYLRKPNVPLLRKTLEHITAHPEEWEQQSWAERRGCGTAACVAGHAVAFAGHEILWDEPDCDCDVCITCVDRNTATNCVVDGQLRTIPSTAAHELGLTTRQANTMFAGSNKLPFLWQYAYDVTNGEIQPPPEMEGSYA